MRRIRIDYEQGSRISGHEIDPCSARGGGTNPSRGPETGGGSGMGRSDKDLLGKQTLCQLSYSRSGGAPILVRRGSILQSAGASRSAGAHNALRLRGGTRSLIRLSSPWQAGVKPSEPCRRVVAAEEAVHVRTRRGQGSIGAVLGSVEPDAHRPARLDGCHLVAWRIRDHDAPDRRNGGRLGQHPPRVGPGRLDRLRRSGRAGRPDAIR